MGRLAEVHFNDVASVANKIMSAGEKPCARAIHIALGKKGSMSTVHAHFKQWEVDQAFHLPSINHEILSTEIARAINLTIFTKIREETANLNNILEEEKAICTQIQKEYDELSLDYEAQSSLLTNMETQYAELVGRAEIFETEIKRLLNDLVNERKAGESARVALAILNHRLERVQQLEVEVEIQRNELKQANMNVAEFRKNSAVAEAKLQAYETNKY